MSELHLVLDSSMKQSNRAIQFFNFNKINMECYKKLRLVSFIVQHETDVQKLFLDLHGNNANKSFKPLHIHCSLLNKDNNFMNGKKSDVLAVMYPNLKLQKAYTTIYPVKLDSGDSKLITPSSYMQLYLTYSNGEFVDKRGKFYLVYAFEFSQ
jgi:hypothetical protein